MITYLPPTSPDYDRIINEELARIRDYSYIKDPAKRSEMEKNNPLYKNPIHNNAEIESFEIAVQSRMLSEKLNYITALDEYKNHLEEQKAELEEQITQKKKEISDKKVDFSLTKKFYDDFQKLVNSKYHFIQTAVDNIFRSKDSDTPDKEEE